MYWTILRQRFTHRRTSWEECLCFLSFAMFFSTTQRKVLGKGEGVPTGTMISCLSCRIHMVSIIAVVLHLPPPRTLSKQRLMVTGG